MRRPWTEISQVPELPEGLKLFSSIVDETFGTSSSIFVKIASKAKIMRKMVCPHCGKIGLLSEKTTVSKKRYSYKKRYVYHRIEKPNGKTIAK